MAAPTQSPELRQRLEVLVPGPHAVPTGQPLPDERVRQAPNGFRVADVAIDGTRAHVVQCVTHNWVSVVWLLNDATCPGCQAEDEIRRDRRTATALLGSCGLLRALGR